MKSSHSQGALVCSIVGCLFLASSIFAVNYKNYREGNEFVLIMVFLAGLVLISLAFWFLYLVKKEKRIKKLLLKSGTELDADVTEVELNTNIEVMGKSPFVIKYSYYTSTGYYEGKSDLIWNEPGYAHGDKIKILADNMGNSMIKPEFDLSNKIN